MTRINLFIALTPLLALLPAQQPTLKPLITFPGHTDAVYAVAASPDGKLIATGSLDKSLKLFDAATGKEVRKIGDKQGHQRQVLCLAFSPDGRAIASGSEDNTLKLWDVNTGNMIRQHPHPQGVACVAYHPSGSKLVTGAGDGRVRIFDATKGALLKEMISNPKQNQLMIYAVAFHPKLEQVASAGFDGAVKIWDTNNGKLVRQFRYSRFFYAENPGHRDTVYSLAFSPDGKHLATASAGQECLIKIWNLDNGKFRDLHNPQLKQPAGFERSHPGAIYGIRYTSDGKHLISAGVAPGNKGYLAIWDADSGKMLHGEESTLGGFFSLALMPNNRQAVVGAGARGKAAQDFNKAYLFQLPGMGK
ncbi:MAG TPA: WD40 repeat domain-containing protein [Gemmataceae bacterium]|nr:WD40 repeat domain-containing protein [Gemmataceae bacterium]